MGAKKFKTVEIGAEDTKSTKMTYEEKRAQRQAAQEAEDAALMAGMTGGGMSAAPTSAEETKAEEKAAKKAIVRVRGSKYLQARSKVDRTKTYSLAEAVKLLQSIKFASFDESLEAHLVLREEVGNMEVQFPYATGKVTKVVIFDDELIPSLDKGIVDFDILLAAPAQMSKLTKYARLLGPKGMMPNPKNGTLTQNPANRKKELESGKTTIKGEKKAPLMHVMIGKISKPEKELIANTQALLEAFQPGKLVKLTLSTSMSPGVKVTI